MRVALDPTTLNENILREHYYISKFTDLCSSIKGAKIFSTLDADCACWQIAVDEVKSISKMFRKNIWRDRRCKNLYR